MAGRSNIGVGLGSAIFVLAVAALAFLILSAVFYTKYKDTTTQLQTARSNISDIIGTGEVNQDWVRGLTQQAKGERKSVVTYLLDQQRETMTKVTGNRNDAGAALATKLEAAAPESKNGVSLLSILGTRDQAIAQLRQDLERANADRATALANQQNEVNRVRQIEESHAATIASLNDQVAQYRGLVEENRSGADQYRATIDKRMERAESDFTAERKRLNEQVAKLTEENVILRSQLSALRQERNKEVLRPDDEFALVDGQVIGVDGAERKAFVSIGEKQRVRLGMTFAVYPQGTAIRPDEAGNYPRGKATLEVIGIGPSSSTCRITGEVRGNPVVSGDVIANAVFDPNKTYRFVIAGNFDINRDGYATPSERNDARALVESWGGRVSEELSGDVDFLVLGERPALPPEPAKDAPYEVFREFVRQREAVRKYEDLYRKAGETSVPILNENRMYTLIGLTPAGVR